MIEVYDKAYYAERERQARTSATHALDPTLRQLDEASADRYADLARACPVRRNVRDW